MRPSHSSLFMALASLVLVAAAGCGDSAVAAPKAGAGRSAPSTRPTGVAVVELFTSEGCSSCPPADELLGALVAEAARDGTPVFPLAFHVDYWDRLGWADRFSSAAHSDRQRAYSAAAGSDRIYTPQMVVNGAAKGFLGSDGAIARREVRAALARPTTVAVRLTVEPATGPRTVRVGYEVSGRADGCGLNVVAVEPEATTAVGRGENAGRSLRHANVVRAFRKVDLKDRSGSVDLELPEGLSAKDVRVIGYAQDARSLAVRGAAIATPK